MKGSHSTPPLLLATLALALSAPFLSAQQTTGSVVGAVVDEATLAPLAAAKVSIADQEVSTITNLEGHFELAGLPAGDWALKIEHLSHVSVVEPVVISEGQVTFVQYALSPVAFVLDQLQVVADRMGPPPVGSAFSELTPTATDMNASAMDLLSARFPSLFITGGDRHGGMNKRVQLRGVRSVVMDNTPALYVDGIRAEISLLANIPGTEVKSIRVLRGATASSMYPNASNGVIVVETVRGVPGGGK